MTYSFAPAHISWLLLERRDMIIKEQHLLAKLVFPFSWKIYP